MIYNVNARLTNVYGPPQAENFGVLKPLSPFGNTFSEGFRAFQKSKNPPNPKKSAFGRLYKNTPLFTNPGLNRGGILIKGGILNNNCSDPIVFPTNTINSNYIGVLRFTVRSLPMAES